MERAWNAGTGPRPDLESGRPAVGGSQCATLSGVTPEQILDQRRRGWPDFHPEDYCHRCGRPNLVWWVDSNLWNVATLGLQRERLEILCPSCFVQLWEARTGQTAVWRLVCERVRDPRPLVMGTTVRGTVVHLTRDRERALCGRAITDLVRPYGDGQSEPVHYGPHWDDDAISFGHQLCASCRSKAD